MKTNEIETLKVELAEVEGEILVAYADNKGVDDLRPLALRRRDLLKRLAKATRPVLAVSAFAR